MENYVKVCRASPILPIHNLTAHMANGFYPITIGNETHSPEAQTRTSNELEWQIALRDAKTNGRIPKCGCVPSVDNPLVIRRHQGSREYYGLARYPKKGHTHNPKCRFHAEKPELSGMQGYTTEVVEELEDGSFKIKLELDRQVRELGAPTGKDSSPARTGARRPRKRAMQLLGLLHFLFTQGRLNVWYPAMKGKRTWPVVARVLLDEADKIVCGSARLSEQLLVGIKVDFGKKSADTEVTEGQQPQELGGRGRENRIRIKEQNDKKLSAAEANKQRLVAISMLSPYALVAESGQKPLPAVLKVSPYEGLPYMKIDEDMWRLAEEHYPLAWSAWRRGDPVCAIVRLQYFEEPFFPGARKMKKDWKVVDIALQSLSNTFIPVESSLENCVEKKLVEEERTFEKPLRFEAGEEEVFPDFILLDTAYAKYPMEVFGRTDEHYEQREAEKRSYYQAHFGADWWCWKAASSKEVPGFPAKAS